MPLYDFSCPEGDVFEAFFSMRDKPDTMACPQCGQAATSRMPTIGPSQTASTQMRILDATKATAEQPKVVNSISGVRTTNRQPTAISQNPLHKKLPRP